MNEFRNKVEQNVETLRNADFEADSVLSHLNGLESDNFIGITGADLLAVRSLLERSITLIDDLSIVDSESANRETYCVDDRCFVPMHGSCKPASGDPKAPDCEMGAEVIRIHKEWCTDEDCEPYDLRCAVGSGNFDILKW